MELNLICDFSVNLPFAQLGPVQPSLQTQRPVMCWQCPLFSHEQRNWQSRPKYPAGQTDKKKSKICHHVNYINR